jgi:hypothetical protein
MFQDTATIDYRYNFFIKRVIEMNLVWGLENEDGWATSSSNENEDIGVIPFWSDRAYANACAKDHWTNYAPTSIPLAEFLENWCVGMANDNTLIGVNWDANMFGKEVNALNLALKILRLLKISNVNIAFLEYNDVDDFIEKLNHSLN